MNKLKTLIGNLIQLTEEDKIYWEKDVEHGSKGQPLVNFIWEDIRLSTGNMVFIYENTTGNILVSSGDTDYTESLNRLQKLVKIQMIKQDRFRKDLAIDRVLENTEWRLK